MTGLRRQKSFVHTEKHNEEKETLKRRHSIPNMKDMEDREPSLGNKQPLRNKTDAKIEKKRHLYKKLKRVHVDQPSLFSSSSGFGNYRGIINLCLLLLVLSNFRVALENILNYGILVDPNLVFVFLEDPYNWPSTTLVVASNIFIQITLFIEQRLSKNEISESVGLLANIINCLLVIVFPVATVVIFKPLPWFSTVALAWYTSVFLKFISYISVNKWCREEKLSKKNKDLSEKPAGPVVYPKNLTQKDLYYFMVAPTYCYELNFPRSTKINKRFLMRRILEFIFLTALLFALCQQWIVPTVINSLKPFQDLDFPRFVERIVKLAIPNHLLWLIFFYTYFHSFLNIVAEVIYFGDRTFYKDWWNAPNITYFWQNWNIPIHRWAKRHVYEPMLRNKYSKVQASLVVFFISAFFHEFLVSVPLQMIKPWAFLSMVMQVPLAIMTSYMKNPWGNIMVWLSLIIGQPLAIMMYYHDYLVQNKA